MIDFKKKEVRVKTVILGNQTEEAVPFGESCSIEQAAVGAVFKAMTKN